MRSDQLVHELGGVIRRLEHRITQTPRYMAVLQKDTEQAAVQQVLDGIEDAIAGLVMLHIQMRRDHE